MPASAAIIHRLAATGRGASIVIALTALSVGIAAQPGKAAKAKAPAAPASRAADPAAPVDVPFVNGYRIAPTPSWVMPIDAPVKVSASVTQGPGYRVLLSDLQTRLDAPGEQQQYMRSRLVASESAALGEVSKAELHFNPAYQTLTLHEAAHLLQLLLFGWIVMQKSLREANGSDRQAHHVFDVRGDRDRELAASAAEVDEQSTLARDVSAGQ